MKQSIVHGFLLGIAFSVGYVPLAIADIAPPPGYVEQCTVEKQQAVGKSCVACPNDYRSTFADAGPSACQVQYEPLGYTKACNSYGASVWTEVCAALTRMLAPTPHHPPVVAPVAARTPNEQMVRWQGCSYSALWWPLVCSYAASARSEQQDPCGPDARGKENRTSSAGCRQLLWTRSPAGQNRS